MSGDAARGMGRGGEAAGSTGKVRMEAGAGAAAAQTGVGEAGTIRIGDQGHEPKQRWQDPERDVEIRKQAGVRIAQIMERGSGLKQRDRKREYKVMLALEILCYENAKNVEEYTDPTKFRILLHRVASEKAKRRRGRQWGEQERISQFPLLDALGVNADVLGPATPTTAGVSSNSASSGRKKKDAQQRKDQIVNSSSSSGPVSVMGSKKRQSRRKMDSKKVNVKSEPHTSLMMKTETGVVDVPKLASSSSSSNRRRALGGRVNLKIETTMTDDMTMDDTTTASSSPTAGITPSPYGFSGINFPFSPFNLSISGGLYGPTSEEPDDGSANVSFADFNPLKSPIPGTGGSHYPFHHPQQSSHSLYHHHNQQQQLHHHHQQQQHHHHHHQQQEHDEHHHAHMEHHENMHSHMPMQHQQHFIAPILSPTGMATASSTSSLPMMSRRSKVRSHSQPVLPMFSQDELEVITSTSSSPIASQVGGAAARFLENEERHKFRQRTPRRKRATTVSTIPDARGISPTMIDQNDMSLDPYASSQQGGNGLTSPIMEENIWESGSWIAPSPRFFNSLAATEGEM